MVAITGIAMLLGLIGTLLPVVPGVPIVWGAALMYGLVDGFDGTAWAFFVPITLLAAAGVLAGIVLPHRHVAATGAPRSTVVAGVTGAVVGFVVIPVLGFPIGGALGVFLAEYNRSNDKDQAWATTKRLLVGVGLGMAVEFASTLAIIVIWVAWVITG